MEDQTQQFLQAEATRAAEELGVNTEPQAQPDEQPQPAEAVTPESQTTEPVTEAPQPEPAQPVVQVDDEDDDYPDIPTFVPYTAPEAPVQQPQQYEQVPSQQVPQQQLTSLDPSQFTDQYGNVDMARFTQAMRSRDEAIVGQVTSNLTQRFTGDFTQMAQRITQQAEAVATRQIMAAETEKRGWERTFAKYPQVKENKELRDQIHKMRLGEVAVTGKPISPVKMADRYFSHIAQAREDGVKQAVETTRVQATAHLETADNTASDKGLKTRQNWERVGSRDRREANNARTDILKQLIADGKL